MADEKKTKIPPPLPPRPSRDLDERLIRFLDEQERCDVKGKLDRIQDDLERYVDLQLQASAENRKEHELLRGDIRGVSLRVGVLEQGQAAHTKAIATLEKQTEKHDDELDDTKRHIIVDLEKKKEKAEGRPAKYIAIAASIIAIVSTLWHLFR